MRALFRSVVFLLACSVATTARAQSQVPVDPSPATPAPGAQSSPDTSSSGFWNRGQSHWTAAGFVGANYGRNLESTGVDFGGQVGYLYHGMVGGEFLVDFAPRFNQGNLFFADSPWVNAYMANAIGAWPIGDQGMIQPFVSGGVGWIQMRSNILNIATFPESGVNAVRTAKGGGNIGGGLMWFAHNVGLRADVRYFRAFNTAFTPGDNATAAEIFAGPLLPGLDFWRTNIGIAFRW